MKKTHLTKMIMLVGLVLLGMRGFGQEATLRIDYKNAETVHTNQTSTSASLASSFTNNTALNTLLTSYNASDYAPYYSATVLNLSLKNCYSVTINGNAANFVAALRNLNLTDSIEIMGMDSVLGCTNPVVINDYGIRWGGINNWANELSDAACAWSIEKGNPDIKMVIVDTDFDLDHEDLQNQIRNVYGPITGGNHHGTAVLGTAGAEPNTIGMIGAGYNLKWDGSRVSHSGTGATGDGVSGGITRAVNNGAKVINVSWTGTGYSTAALQDLVDQGITVVLAAGNDNFRIRHAAARNIDGVIIVSGVDENGSHVGTTSTNSNGVTTIHAHNDLVELCAQSIHVTATFDYDPSDPNAIKYGNTKGTSNAAPQVTAAAGLILSLNECFTPAMIEEILVSTTKPIIDANDYPGELGSGYLDMYSALTMAVGRSGALTTSETWSDLEIVSGQLVIPSGVTLTITDRVLCYPDAKILVKKGGKLILNGGIISSICDQWEGIYVEGDRNLPQGPASSQGSFFIQNGGTIEHARTGVTLCGIYPNGNLDHSKSGGRLIANEAIFRDNFRDVSFTGYHHFSSSSSFSSPNVSSFIKCQFTTTNDYRSDFVSDIWPNVTMWGVVHVRFRGCTWHDQRDGTVDPRMDDYLQRRVGMFTMDASYLITDLYANQPLESGPPTTLVNSSFIDMKYGIESLDNPLSGNNYTAGKPSVVQDVQFQNCLGGIYHSGVEGALLNRNEFQINPYAVPTFRDIEAYGIYLDNCNGYQAEGNHFSSNLATSLPNEYSVGFITNANEDKNNDIYRNTFDDNLLGAEAIGWNKHQNVGLYPQIGLKYKCNDFANTSDNYLDIWATHHQTIPYTTAQTDLPQQGGGLDPMGNIFGAYGSTGNRNFNYLQSSSTFVQYFHHDPASEPRVEPVIHWGVNSHNTGVVYSNAQCPDNTATGYYISGGQVNTVNTHLSTLIVKIDEVWDVVDGGNTPGLVNLLVTVSLGSASGLVSDMTNYSPYLSDEVLLTLSTSYSAITHLQIRDLLMLNPHSARNPNIINALQNRTDNFPTAYIAAVIGVSGTTTARDDLMDEVYHHSNAYDAGVNSILIKALNDSVDRFEEIVEPLLIASNRPQHKYRLASLYDSRGNSSEANSVLASIPAMPDFNASRLDYHTDLMALRATLKSWDESNVDITNLNATQIALLQSYEQESNGIQYKVQPLLTLNEASSYIAPIYAPDVTPTNSPRISNNENTSNVTDERSNDRISLTESNVSSKYKVLGLKLYPNPVQTQLNVSYELAGNFRTGSITIYTLDGKQVNTVKFTEASGVKQIDVSGIRNGQYICTIEANGEVLKQLKFAITR